MRGVYLVRSVCMSIVFGMLATVGNPQLAYATAEVNFESGHVRPLAFVTSEDLLFAVSTPRDRLIIFEADAGGLTNVGEVDVGFEPVAVAARVRGDGKVEAWVVNHVSDNVSVVLVDPAAPASARVIRTVLVGDEPRDIVFGGSGGNRVFITAAHRGQNFPGDPQPFTPEVGRTDVWVFDADDLGGDFGGTPLTVLSLFGDTPRGLAVSPDGSKVYAAVFHSGSRTATVHNLVRQATAPLPPAPPGATPDPPPVGLIVKYDPSTDRWEDEIGRDWRAQIPFDLLDLDVFEIDADAPVPVEADAFTGVGTTLFNLAVRPDTGAVYVSNTEALNHVRFEPVIRGHITESRITVLAGGSVSPVHLNPHIDYGVVPGPPAEVVESLAFPMDMVFSADGQTLYLTAFGSGAIAVFDTDDLEAGTVSPRPQVAVGGGPSGVALDAVRDRLYVMLAFDHAVATVENASQGSRALAGTTSLGVDPRPAAVRDGQRFLYDARETSAHGDAACASCHIFGDLDHLAWDLGDALGAVLHIDNPTISLGGAPGVGVDYHPAKGPFLTQTLRGLVGAGPMHWRGDRSAAASGGSAFDADGSFKTFNVAFPGLLGRAAPLSAADLQAFTDFALTLAYPPNPFRPLDDVATESQAAGEVIYVDQVVDLAGSCNVCHTLPLTTNGFVGIGFDAPDHPLKVPNLRGIYQKIGLFGVVPTNDHFIPPYFGGDVIRGFGIQFDGSLPSLVDFHAAFLFLDDDARHDVASFVIALEAGLKPAVGQQLTLVSEVLDDPALFKRLAQLTRADRAGHCYFGLEGPGGTSDLWRYAWGTNLTTGRQSDELLDVETVRSILTTTETERTGTCDFTFVAGDYAFDADRDTVSRIDEIEAGSDPQNAASLPPGFDIVPVSTKRLVIRDGLEKSRPDKRRVLFRSITKKDPGPNRIVAPARNGPGDPRTHGATLIVYNTNGSGEHARIPLPPSGWVAKGSDTRPRGYLFKGVEKNDPVRKLLVQDDKIILTAGRELFDYTLNEFSQGSIAVRVTMGTDVQWCAEATPRVDEADRFISESNIPPPTSCPSV